MRLSWVCAEYGALCCRDGLLITCLKCPVSCLWFLPLPPASITPKTTDDTTAEPADGPECTVGCHLSECGRYLAAITSHKRLLLWQAQQQQQQQRHSWDLINSWRLVKRPVDVVFDGAVRHMLVADKTGDVLQLSVKGGASTATATGQRHTVLLGHLSMLLSLTMSSCGRMIVSGDRDEKVRVSHYPRAHNIASFCLGHSEFVAQLRTLPSHPRTLLSASGDGSLRLWNLESGKELCKADTHPQSELHCIPLNGDLSNSPSPTPNSVPSNGASSITPLPTSSSDPPPSQQTTKGPRQSRSSAGEGTPSSGCGSRERVVPPNCAITSIAVTKATETSSECYDVVAVAFERSRCVVVYGSSSDRLQYLGISATLPAPATTLLWVAPDTLAAVCPPECHVEESSPVLVWRWSAGQLVPLLSHPLAVFAAQHSDRFKDVPRMDASVLFKQRYDNVAEYQKKKENRLQQEKEKQKERSQLEPDSCKRMRLSPSVGSL